MISSEQRFESQWFNGPQKLLWCGAEEQKCWATSMKYSSLTGGSRHIYKIMTTEMKKNNVLKAMETLLKEEHVFQTL